MSDVFICHSAEDTQIATSIYNALIQRGINCWMAPNNTTPGTDWTSSVNSAITSSPVFLLIYSNSAAASTQVQNEMTLAANSGVTIIPYLVEDCPVAGSFQYYLSNRYWVKADLARNDLRIDELAGVINNARYNNSKSVSASVNNVPYIQNEQTASKKINWGIISIVLIVLVIIGALLASVITMPKDKETTKNRSDDTTEVQESETTEIPDTPSPADDTGISEEMIDKWVEDAISYCTDNDLTSFKTLFADDVISDDIQLYYDEISYICNQNGTVNSDYLYIESETTDQCYCYMYFYANEIDGDPFNTTDYTMDAYFMCEDETALFTLSPDRNTEDAEDNYFTQKYDDYYNYSEGFLANRYWTVTEQALLSGINCKIQKIKQNSDGSLTVSLGIANGFDYPISDLRLCNSTDTTTLFIGTDTIETQPFYEYEITDVINDISQSTTMKANEFRVYKFTIAAEELPDGFDFVNKEYVYLETYISYTTENSTTPSEYPAADPQQRTTAEEMSEAWLLDVMYYAQTGDYSQFQTLFADDVNIEYYYDELRYFYNGGADGTLTTPSIYYDVSGVFRNYATIDFMIYGKYANYPDSDDSTSSYFYLEFRDDGTTIASKDCPFPLVIQYCNYYDKLFEVDFDYSDTTQKYWLMYEIAVVNDVMVDLRSASRTDDGSLRLEFGCANGTDSALTDLKLYTSSSNTVINYDDGYGTDVDLFEYNTTPYTVVDDWSSTIGAGEYDSYVIIIDSSALPSDFSDYELFGNIYNTISYSWNWA